MLVAGRGSTSTRPAELDDRVMQDVGLGGEVELRMRCDVDVVAMDGPLCLARSGSLKFLPLM